MRRTEILEFIVKSSIGILAVVILAVTCSLLEMERQRTKGEKNYSLDHLESSSFFHGAEAAIFVQLAWEKQQLLAGAMPNGSMPYQDWKVAISNQFNAFRNAGRK